MLRALGLDTKLIGPWRQGCTQVPRGVDEMARQLSIFLKLRLWNVTQQGRLVDEVV